MYDSNQNMNSNEALEAAMEPMCTMLPNYCMSLDLTHKNTRTLQHVRRLFSKGYTHHKSNKEKKKRVTPMYVLLHIVYILFRRKTYQIQTLPCSGDCGIFAIKHMENLIANKELYDGVDKNTRFWREKLCVNLFYHNFDLIGYDLIFIWIYLLLFQSM